MHFKVRPSTKFSKVFDAYCQRKALQPNAVRFLMDGERLRPDQTPEEMDMEDGDCIDAMMEQVGGGCAGNAGTTRTRTRRDLGSNAIM